MTWADFLEYLDNFRTDRVLEQLAAWNIDELSSNPYVLGGFAVAIAITYLIGWKTTSAFIVGIGGFALAVSYTVRQGTGIEGVGDGLPLLVGSGLIVVIIFIYLLFVKAE